MPTATPAATSIEPDGGLVVRARLRGGRTVVDELAASEPWLGRILAGDGPTARVVLVQSRAALLAGDRVGVRIELGPGAGLELVELGATVANHVRGGAGAGLETVLRLAEGARLVWLAQPLIASRGCWLERLTRVELAAGARALLGESIVLGRHRQAPGRVRSRTRITREGRPLVDETIETEPAWLLGSAVVAGDARMIAALTLAGVRDPGAPAGAFQADGPATLWRGLGPADASLSWPGSLASRWRALVLGGLAGLGGPEPPTP